MSSMPVFAWLLAPIDSARAHALAGSIAWHARAMVLAWGVLFPLGVTAARFFKIMPRQRWPERLDNKIWWHAHLGLQYCGGVVVLAGLGFVWMAPDRGATGGTLHGWLGWAAMAFCGSQFLGGWLRGSKGGPTDPRADGSLAGDHFDMTARRRIFEYGHKTLGYLAQLLAAVAILEGLWLVNAPNGLWLALISWWLALIAAWVILQRRGFAIDTYQAIWGPDPTLPGNRRTTIGLGVRRPTVPVSPDSRDRP